MTNKGEVIKMKIKQLICKIAGHNPVYFIDSKKKRRLKHGVMKVCWDVDKVCQCSRCNKDLGRVKLYRNLSSEQYLKTYAFDHEANNI